MVASRVRDICNTHRTIFGERTVVGLFCLNSRGTMHSQLPQDWEDLVRQFYRHAFSVFYKSGGLNTSHDLTCGGCGN